ncbi:MAG: hypothetical protein J5700_02245 [Treponema sp.]|nr:hypothetical protein [Treponema sp.]
MAVFLVSSLTLINLLLWLVFLFRFKKLFSADDIMLKFRDGMDGLIREAQHNTLSNINLIDDKIKELKAASAEAERKVAILRHELQTAEKSAALQAQLNLQSSASAMTSVPKTPAKKTKSKTTARSARGGSRAAAAYKQNELPGADEAVALTGLFKENAEKSLFDAPQITVTKDGDAYGKVPVIKTQVVASDNPIKPKKPFVRRVKELAELGKTVEEIADETDHSTTEVQLVLDMSI